MIRGQVHPVGPLLERINSGREDPVVRVVVDIELFELKNSKVKKILQTKREYGSEVWNSSN